MPKKPRQAHIPSVVKRRRNVRRPGAEGTTSAYNTDGMINEPAFAGAAASTAAAPASAPPAAPQRTGRRMEQLRTGDTTGVRVIPGQLPTFERAYLLRELRLTGTISAALLGVIIVLTLLLR